jgi:hypothetical protein
MYVACTGFRKVSTALFITNLSGTAPQIRPVFILAAVSNLWMAAAILLLAIHPNPNANQPWVILDKTATLVGAKVTPTRTRYNPTNFA